MLQNGNFDLGTWTRKTHTGQEYGEIFVPTGWTAFWKEGLPVPHDPTNPNGYGRPEMHVIQRVPPFLDPPRIDSPEWAVKMFTFYRIHDAGLYQQVQVGTGTLKLSARAHAWSSTHDDPHHSETSGDAANNFTFRVGIDPEGGTDPWGPRVIWGRGLSIYDAYEDIPSLTVETHESTVTIFLRSEVLYPFKHCDAYFDSVVLEESTPPLPTPPGTVPYYQRESYAKTVHVPTAACTLARWLEIAEIAYNQRSTISGSADDALGHAPGQSATGIFYDLSSKQQQDMVVFRDLYYPEAIVKFENSSTPPDPSPIPQKVQVEKGVIVGWGTIGGQGQEPMIQTLAAQGVYLPTAKFVQDLGAAAVIKSYSPTTKIVGRKIDINGQNIEGFNYAGDPISQADSRMNALQSIMAANPAIDYWEIVNEQQPPSSQSISVICEFFKHAMAIATSWGKKLAIFSFSTGTPEPNAWDYAYTTGVFQQVLAEGHVISLHAYGHTPDDLTYHLLRFKFLYDNVLIPNGLGNIPLYMTEYGEWKENFGSSDLMQQLIEYDMELAKLPYVAGAHVYVNPWDPPYNTYPSLYSQYIQYTIDVKDRRNG